MCLDPQAEFCTIYCEAYFNNELDTFRPSLSLLSHKAFSLFIIVYKDLFVSSNFN